MELSIFLAKVWGLFLVITCLAALIKRKSFQSIMKDFENYGLLYLSGFFSLLIGVLIVVSHNVWSADWRVIITLLGWMSLIKGVTRFFWPELTIKMIEKTKDASWFSPVMVVFLVVGVYLMYVGFGS